jgi:hypothetical protein
MPTDRWKYTRSYAMDGNFMAKHLKMQNPEDDVHLRDGTSFLATDQPYKDKHAMSTMPSTMPTWLSSRWRPPASEPQHALSMDALYLIQSLIFRKERGKLL